MKENYRVNQKAILKLISVANKLDSLGFKQEADKIDILIKESSPSFGLGEGNKLKVYDGQLNSKTVSIIRSHYPYNGAAGNLGQVDRVMRNAIIHRTGDPYLYLYSPGKPDLDELGVYKNNPFFVVIKGPPKRLDNNNDSGLFDVAGHPTNNSGYLISSGDPGFDQLLKNICEIDMSAIDDQTLWFKPSSCNPEYFDRRNREIKLREKEQQRRLDYHIDQQPGREGWTSEVDEDGEPETDKDEYGDPVLIQRDEAGYRSDSGVSRTRSNYTGN